MKKTISKQFHTLGGIYFTVLGGQAGLNGDFIAHKGLQ